MVDLVHHEQYSLRVGPKFLGERFVFRHEPGDAVHDPAQQVALFDRDLTLSDDLLFERSVRTIL